MITQIRPSQLPTWLESVRGHGQPVVLDVREPSELAVASIQANGFDLVTIPMGVIPPRLTELDPSQPIACLCHHGGRSMQVASFLKARGFDHVANIAGGINAWSTEVDPSVPRY
jgi:rhodanese-related sulfurtransferase